MKAIPYKAFCQPLKLLNPANSASEPHGLVIQVMATGMCCSNWHGRAGDDAGIALPEVQGDQLAGIVEAIGKEITRRKTGDPLIVPVVTEF